jgi:glyoxylase-like metal-dependent hydrolase (beta-lactamase superfamily II)
VTVVAHANTRQWLAATIRKRGEEILHKPVPKDQLPNKTFRDKLSVPFRGGSMELGYLFQAHTDGDIYARFPQQNVLFTGPLVHSDKWSPVDESTNGYIGAFADDYDEMSKLVDDKTIVVPESGPVIGKTEFEAERTVYKNLLKEMIALLRKGRSADDVVAANPAVGVRPEWGNPADFLDQGFRSFYGNLRDGRHLGAIP